MDGRVREIMKAVILAAGEGARLWPLTQNQPKVMVHVAGKPILQYVIEALRDSGISEIILVVGYRREKIMSYFEDGSQFGVHISYVSQNRLLGTAHALSKVKGETGHEFLVLPGDNIINSEVIKDLLHEKKDGEWSVALSASRNASKYGVVFMSGSRVRRIVEKPKESRSSIISTGIFLLTEEVFEYIDDAISEREYALSTVIQSAIPAHVVRGVKTDGVWQDAVYPWDLLDLNATALRMIHGSLAGKKEPNVVVKGHVKIGEGTVLRSGTYIEGPVVIGSGCDIGPNAVIMPEVSVGNNCVIGPHTTLETSILMSNCYLGSHSYLSHSVMGEGSIMESHFKNRVGPALIKIDTVHEVERIGAIAAEDCRFAAGTTLAAGTMIGEGSIVEGEKIVTGTVPENGRVL